ncbi:MAG: hypothetical protein [Inoviridae sp.]|nr:MAG: hypothetical protein [Inoviridae sp.]
MFAKYQTVSGIKENMEDAFLTASAMPRLSSICRNPVQSQSKKEITVSNRNCMACSTMPLIHAANFESSSPTAISHAVRIMITPRIDQAALNTTSRVGLTVSNNLQ